MTKFKERQCLFWSQLLIGYMGECHNCDSRIVSNIKLGHYFKAQDGWNFQFVVPLECSYCGYKHLAAFIDYETTMQRAGEVWKLH